MGSAYFPLHIFSMGEHATLRSKVQIDTVAFARRSPARRPQTTKRA